MSNCHRPKTREQRAEKRPQNTPKICSVNHFGHHLTLFLPSFWPVNHLRTTKNWVKTALIFPNLVGNYISPFRYSKTPENLDFPGFLNHFETVLREFLSCFPLIFRAFPAFCLSVIRCADHKKRPFFIQRQADETHHLLPQTTPLVYCTSLLHKCP